VLRVEAEHLLRRRRPLRARSAISGLPSSGPRASQATLARPRQLRAALKLDIEERRKIPTWTKTLSRLIERRTRLCARGAINGHLVGLARLRLRGGISTCRRVTEDVEPANT
jgi:hypothetical protein